MAAGNVDGNILDQCLGDSNMDKIFLSHIVVVLWMFEYLLSCLVNDLETLVFERILLSCIYLDSSFCKQNKKPLIHVSDLHSKKQCFILDIHY